MKDRSIFDKVMNIYDKVGVYVLGLVVSVLNISLAFDNVVWGDEAYSQMAIRNCNLYGIYERIYYWDSHPPFYYYYLRLFADLFGYKTPVYHIASLVPFVVGVILACTLIKKHMGAMSATLFIIISGLSESCVEYNLEIRMYSLVFLFTLLCAYCSYMIVKDMTDTAVNKWILMTIWGVLSAYTHYFGLLMCGLIILCTGIAYQIIHKGKSWIRGLVCTLTYIIVYIPWLFVLFKQTQSELGDSWMTEPEGFGRILQFITGGHRLCYIMVPFIVIMTVLILKSEISSVRNGKSDRLTGDCIAIILNWSEIIILMVFSYAVSLLFHPILAFRYTYVMIPLILMITILCMKKLMEYVAESKYKAQVTAVTLVIVAASLLLGLLDFKYFRSVTKTQDVQTNMVLNFVDEYYTEDTVFCSNGVKHLAWTVLPYYYPDNEVTMDNPNELEGEPDHICAFMGYQFAPEVIEEMEEKGYTVVDYDTPLGFGKYGIFLYHFNK